MRVDKYCAEHFPERFSSRTKAAEAANRGEILLNGKEAKPSDEVKEGAEISFCRKETAFVSNGGAKLAQAIRVFAVDCKGKVFADVGASTGGFTDCLLQNGAQRVYCVDVGESLLDPKIKNDPRTVCMDNTNARFLRKDSFPEALDGIVIDVSFISLRLILPVLRELIEDGGIVLALIKPQFECENKKLLSKSGIVTDPKLRKKIIEKIYFSCMENGLQPIGIVNAPVREKKNIEYVIYLKKGEDKPLTVREIIERSEQTV